LTSTGSDTASFPHYSTRGARPHYPRSEYGTRFSDADFSVFLQNFLTYASANLAALGLVAADLTPVQTANTAWGPAYSAHIAAQAAAQAAREQKDGARQAVEDALRPLVNQIQATPTVTDAQRQSLGITVRSTTRTAVGAPTTRPVATVDTSQRLRHTISFVDELTPSSRAKPDGVSGCEVWVKIGTAAPVDPSELVYLATDTKTPYTAEYDGADAGKIAYYMLRWVSTRGERGPWSQTVSGTITS
jgi:hypothetical protein